MKVKLIESKAALEEAFAIRQKVFVEEQEVPADEEYDEFEDHSRHFLAYSEDGQPCGTARWRFTDKGIKLERFAVLAEWRGKGTGQTLVQAVVNDIAAHHDSKGKTLYLHAQLPAVSLYERFGFKKAGEIFEECGIQHYLMQK